MAYRSLLVGATLAAAIGALAPTIQADMIAVDNGIAVKETDVSTPARGMTMDQVTAKFGAPVTKVPAVGKPPISRWEYPGFVVYFEHEHVIHCVVSDASSPPPAPAQQAAPASDAAPDPAATAPAPEASSGSSPPSASSPPSS
ncbi:MAG TPA: hypothetical protein VK437_00775 [Steroidobacteraceae bacterium]|nr:hypothetical protein [Steroidobacteraceae bacterium]